jgi:cytochrome c oxidase assembly protein subunit 15
MRSRFALTPETYRRITIAAAILLAIIIVTGGAVRLSGSGLGCSDWPTCEPGQLTPRHSSDVNAMVEFLNRVFTGLVSVAVIVCVLGSLVRTPRRRDLVWLSVGLVIGVFAQAVLGGLTVLFELRPELVTAHFLVSLALLANALVLVRRAGQPDAPARPVLLPSVRWVGPALLVAVSLVVVTGTVVTSTGPHGGDAKAKRFEFFLPDVARVHGISVVVFLLLVLITLWLIRQTHAPVVVQRRLGFVLAAAVVQGAIGYIQYFNGIPELLVGFHIAGATAVWSAVVCFYLSLFSRVAPITGAVEMPAHAQAPAR